MSATTLDADMAPTAQVQLLARVEELARREGLLTAETSKATIFRDRVGGTVAWLPKDNSRLELTLIQIRMVDEAMANRLHGLLVQCCDRTTADIPSHNLGVEAAIAVEHWARLERDFFPVYLAKHREVQAAQGRGPRPV